MQRKPTVVITFHGKDEPLVQKVRKHLEGFESEGRIELWDHEKVPGGGGDRDAFVAAVRRTVDEARCIVCLLSPEYLTEGGWTATEAQLMMRRRHGRGLGILPVLARPCEWRAEPWLRDLRLVAGDDKGLAAAVKKGRDDVLGALAVAIAETARTFHVPDDPDRFVRAPGEVSIQRLPRTDALLLGREDALRQLDAAWADPDACVAAVHGLVGSGKSALVRRWCEWRVGDPEAARVFAWSFDDQGVLGRRGSTDLFMQTALRFFGDEAPARGMPWQQAERLAALVRTRRSVLVLDGLQVHQARGEDGAGRLRDQALRTLVEELARENPGLCVITSEVPFGDLVGVRTVRSLALGPLPAPAARAWLRVAGVRGPDEEIDAIVSNLGGNALALELGGAYIGARPDVNYRVGREIPDLFLTDEQGRNARRVMVAWALHFGAGVEVEVLRALGLFDLPARRFALERIGQKPVIKGLSEHLSNVSPAVVADAIDTLRRARLLRADDGDDGDGLGCHPLLREHFGTQLRRDHALAWQEGHRRLFGYYQRAVAEDAESLEELTPLFAAVGHGCEGGYHVRALADIYAGRLLRREQSYAIRTLRAYGQNLAALASFFTEPWRRLVRDVSGPEQTLILDAASYCLAARGEFDAAIECLQTGLDWHVAAGMRDVAAGYAAKLSELLMKTGRLGEAEDRARDGFRMIEGREELFLEMIYGCNIADIMHQRGKRNEARTLFEAADRKQAELQPDFPHLYSTRGARYADLLLAEGEFREVRRRVEQTMTWLDDLGAPAYDVAVDRLILGRVLMAEAMGDPKHDFAPALEHIEGAIAELRRTAREDEIPRAVLTRATLLRVRGGDGDLEAAERDIDEVFTLAMRTGLKLYEADARLERAKLLLARAQREEDVIRRNHVLQDLSDAYEAARQPIEEMGYGRRTRELVALKEQYTTLRRH